jgi:hypothetical protein
MKKLIATAVLLLMVPALAPAQNGDHPYRGQGYVVFGLGTGLGSVYSPDRAEQVSFGGEGFLDKGLGFGGEVGYAYWGGGSRQAWIPSVDVSYHFGGHAARADPFVLAGFTAHLPGSSGRRGEPAGTVGGGVNVWVKEHAALRFEVRNDISSGIFGLGNDYLSFRIGVTFR